MADQPVAVQQSASNVAEGPGSAAAGPRRFTRRAFEAFYQSHILTASFFEQGNYYHKQRARYRNSLKAICELDLPRPASVLEIGGGQIAVLMQAMFNDRGIVADVNESYKDSIIEAGLAFRCCDLLHDDLDDRNAFDLVVLCEVVEHLPVPPHRVLERVRRWIKPGGYLFITTPNLYRLRNVVRLATGGPLFCPFMIPERGRFIGHPLEYSQSHLAWQLEQAGFDQVTVSLRQLDNAGATAASQLGRLLAAPLLLRPTWRDKLVATGRRPMTDG